MLVVKFSWKSLEVEMGINATPSITSRNPREWIGVWGTFELNQLKCVPSQLLPVFSVFDRL